MHLRRKYFLFRATVTTITLHTGFDDSYIQASERSTPTVPATLAHLASLLPLFAGDSHC
jgi:hypothetical protein